MTLPKDDPSLVSGSSPLFTDVNAVRGDHLRSNNGDIWDNCEYLDSAQGHGDAINAASAKATPVDADMVGLMDSAASNVLKKLSWANIKATLKTYFDTLYVALTGNQSIAGIKTFTDTTDSTTKDTGAIITEGGIGCEKALYTGDEIYAGKGRKPTGYIQDSSATENEIFDAIAPSIPNTSDEMLVSGSLVTGDRIYVFSRVLRLDSDTIRFPCASIDISSASGSTSNFDMDNGGSSTYAISVAW